MSKELKELVAKTFVERISNGDVLAVGAGSTVDECIRQLGLRDGLDVRTLKAISSSDQSAALCEKVGITVFHRQYGGCVSIGFDGADEIDPQLRLIKGKGGLQTLEKVLAERCRQERKPYVILADESKIVSRLGERTAVPVEIIPATLQIVKPQLERLGAKKIELRFARSTYGPVRTELGNHILDVSFSEISDELEGELCRIVGVIETGLFVNYATEALIAGKDGVKSLTR